MFICLLTTIIVVSSVFFTFLKDKIHWALFVFGIILSIIQITSYVFTALANPGLPKAEYESMIDSEEGKNLRRCKDCRIWVNTDEATFHCRECGICIEGILFII
jgi:hypothetical protein